MSKDKKQILNLYIVRHGQTEWNSEKRFQGHKDSPLTELGKRQAEQLRNSLKGIQWENIYSSSLQRTLATAEIISRDQLRPIIPSDDLQEMSFGEWEGKLQKEIAQNEPLRFEALWHSPSSYIASSGEDFYEVKERALRVLRRVIKENPCGNVLIVTHTVIVKILMAYFEERSIETLWEPPFIHPASLCKIEISNNQVNILLHGDISHYE